MQEQLERLIEERQQLHKVIRNSLEENIKAMRKFIEQLKNPKDKRE
ncbi:MAG: hypothetical protein HY232_07075 [Acidobacteria bacterium]|nr:hypothetical protein [Acidobacteriota bacterium]